MFDRFYINWNYSRIKRIIDHFGHDAFFEKTVLDLGCGHADIGNALSRLGARVIAVDARQEHLNIAKKKYPHITIVQADLDQEWPFGKQQFDFVLNLGLLCHLTNYREVLKRSCYAAKNLILELEICDSNDPDRVVQVDEPRSIYDWSFNGVGHKPSAANIENILEQNGMLFERMDDASLNSSPYYYDWKVDDTNSRKIGARRFWVATKNPNFTTISSPKIEKPAPQKQEDLNPFPLIIKPESSYRASQSSLRKEGFKVAFCISGYLRNFEKTFEKLFSNLLKNTEPDIFIHTWEYMGAPLRGFDAHLTRLRTRDMLSRINRLYRPKKIIIEPIIQFPTIPLMHQRNYERRDINGVLSMFYKIDACNQIKKQYEEENNFIYDCVIRYRSDLLILNEIKINKDISKDKIFIPYGNDFGGVNDQLAYGSSPLMDKYSDVYNNIEHMMKAGETFNPEKLLAKHLKNTNVPVSRFHLNYSIKRS